MLSYIRDKLKTWVLILVIFIVAIPLIFLGVGDYGTNQESYAFKVNDNEVGRVVVLQEMSQFKEVLRKNYQNSIPPIYTDEFIKKITLDNLVRRNIENSISSEELNLVYSNSSIINDIENTSAFRDDDGFNPDLYKRRLFMINMSPEIYEQYIYQKGIRDQLRESITNTSFITSFDKKISISSNYSQKKGELLILNSSQVKDKIKVSLDEINSYYETNKGTFLSDEQATFEYLRVNKESFVKNIQISDDEIRKVYTDNLNAGSYDLPDKYNINHIVFPIDSNKSETIRHAKQAMQEISNGKSFDYIIRNYAVDKDTKKNNGIISDVLIDDLPEIISTNLTNMNINEIKLITSGDNAIHIVKLLMRKDNLQKEYNTVKNKIENQLKNDKGSKDFFVVLDKIKESIYSNKLKFSEISNTYNLTVKSTPKLDATSTYSDFPNDIIQRLFSSISSNIFPPIYIDNDDVLFIQKKSYQSPKQLSLKDSEDAIRALLFTNKLIDNMEKFAKQTLNSLNSNQNNISPEKFSIYSYDKKYSKEIIDIIFNQRQSEIFTSYKLNSGDYLFLKINSINSESIDNERVLNDNFLDYIENTQSESDYNNLYITKYDNFDVEINEDFIN